MKTRIMQPEPQPPASTVTQPTAPIDEQREKDRLLLEAHIVAVTDAFDAMTSTR